MPTVTTAKQKNQYHPSPPGRYRRLNAKKGQKLIGWMVVVGLGDNVSLLTRGVANLVYVRPFSRAEPFISGEVREREIERKVGTT